MLLFDFFYSLFPWFSPKIKSEFDILVVCYFLGFLSTASIILLILNVTNISFIGLENKLNAVGLGADAGVEIIAVLLIASVVCGVGASWNTCIVGLAVVYLVVLVGVFNLFGDWSAFILMGLILLRGLKDLGVSSYFLGVLIAIANPVVGGLAVFFGSLLFIVFKRTELLLFVAGCLVVLALGLTIVWTNPVIFFVIGIIGLLFIVGKDTKLGALFLIMASGLVTILSWVAVLVYRADWGGAMVASWFDFSSVPIIFVTLFFMLIIFKKENLESFFLTVAGSIGFFGVCVWLCYTSWWVVFLSILVISIALFWVKWVDRVGFLACFFEVLVVVSVLGEGVFAWNYFWGLL
jgi:hypothetical protein